MSSFLNSSNYTPYVANPITLVSQPVQGGASINLGNTVAASTQDGTAASNSGMTGGTTISGVGGAGNPLVTAPTSATQGSLAILMGNILNLVPLILIAVVGVLLLKYVFTKK